MMKATPQIRVTIEDLLTGDTEKMEITDDYVLILAGTAFLHGTQVFSNGTHVLTVKGRLQ